MLKVRIEKQFSAAAEAVWQVLRSFELKYFKNYPFTITGSGVGAERSFALPQGEMTERITAFSDPDMSLSYTIVKGPWPVKNYTASIQVAAAGEGCNVTWSAKFETDSEDAEDTAEMVAGTFKMNLRAIEKFISSTK